MIPDLTSALIKDIIHFLKKERTFFSAPNAEKAEQMIGSKIIARHLSRETESSFVNDLGTTIKILSNSEDFSGSNLLKSLGVFFVEEFSLIFDQLDKDFYRSTTTERRKKLDQLLPHGAAFMAELRYFISLYSVQEMTEEIVVFLQALFKSPRVLTQSPIECDRETKDAIRRHFGLKLPKSFVAFSINAQLIGGIRFFIDGKVVDRSWFSRIQAIHRLKELV